MAEQEKEQAADVMPYGVTDAELISMLTDDVTDTKTRQMYEIILKNEINYVRANRVEGTPFSPINKLLIPITRRIVAHTDILSKVVGVQPMTGPVGKVYTMQYTTDDVEVAADGEDPLSIDCKKVTQSRIRLEICSEDVEAGSQRLGSRFSLEAAQDSHARYGLDIEAELCAALADEVSSEIISNIVTDLYRIASKNTTHVDIPDTPPTQYLGDRISVGIVINQNANEIARRTRRGCGNFVITTVQGAELLSENPKSVWVGSPRKATSQADGCLKFEGTLNNSINVYSTTLALSDADEKIPFIVGYKGNSETDTGYFYCPYVPLMPSGPVVNPVTFQPAMTFMTRFGKYACFPDAEKSTGMVPYDSTSYYRLVTCTNNQKDQPEQKSAQSAPTGFTAALDAVLALASKAIGGK